MQATESYTECDVCIERAIAYMTKILEYANMSAT
jgi:hypothetical protein